MTFYLRNDSFSRITWSSY